MNEPEDWSKNIGCSEISSWDDFNIMKQVLITFIGSQATKLTTSFLTKIHVLICLRFSYPLNQSTHESISHHGLQLLSTFAHLLRLVFSILICFVLQKSSKSFVNFSFILLFSSVQGYYDQ